MTYISISKKIKKVCKHCEKEIKGKPRIHDDYYFCNGECIRKYLCKDNTS